MPVFFATTSLDEGKAPRRGGVATRAESGKWRVGLTCWGGDGALPAFLVAQLPEWGPQSSRSPATFDPQLTCWKFVCATNGSLVSADSNMAKY